LAKKIGRRRFIFATILSGVSLYVAGWWIFKVRNGDATDIIVAILKKRLNYINVGDSDLEKFAADFQYAVSPKRRYLGSWAGILRPVYSVVDIFKISPYSKEFRSFEEFSVTIFLLSSDFFQHGADLDRKIRYLRLFDPYEYGCDNPFVNL
jgi:hypothetical protein